MHKMVANAKKTTWFAKANNWRTRVRPWRNAVSKYTSVERVFVFALGVQFTGTPPCKHAPSEEKIGGISGE